MGDLYSILRHAAVMRVARQQMEESRRINISGIAATTGIPRSEISKILKAGKRPPKTVDARLQSTNRILAAWHEEPRFTTPNGEPADLKLFGRGTTFDLLVKRHGGGIPTRAVLDELVRIHAVILLPLQKVRARTSLAVHAGISPQMIRVFGERTADLMDTLVSNLRNPENPRFVASISGSLIKSENLPLFRRDVSNRGIGFLEDVQESLVQPASRNRRVGDGRVGVTVFYHESRPAGTFERSGSRRTNFRRRS